MIKEAVIGLGFGDEGKGLVTDWRCSLGLFSNPSLESVVRFSGGHQAGHNVVLPDGRSHIFSNFGSGTLRGVSTIWDAETFDPTGFLKEYKLLQDYDPKITINPLCPITTPFEKVINADREKSNKHGSVGVGFADTLRREEKGVHLYVADLMASTSIFNLKLSILENYYLDLFGYYEGPGVEWLQECAEVKEILLTQNRYTPVELGGFARVIYEGSQGLLLDRDYGFYPHMTYARLGTQKKAIQDVDKFFLVTRAYQTRHGPGPHSSTPIDPKNLDETNKLNKFQGVFKTFALDLDMLKYSLNIDPGIREAYDRSLVITCLDQIEDQWMLVDDGKVEVFPSEKKFLRYIHKALKYIKMYTSYGPTSEDIREY